MGFGFGVLIFIFSFFYIFSGCLGGAWGYSFLPVCGVVWFSLAWRCGVLCWRVSVLARLWRFLFLITGLARTVSWAFEPVFARLSMDKRLYVGIDIAKRSFDVGVRGAQGAVWHASFDNEVAGFEGLALWLGGLSVAQGALVVLTMEATGVYWEALAFWAVARGVAGVCGESFAD